VREWPTAKARRVLAALHDGDDLGPRMLARIARDTGLRPEDL
jgi:hypothetical protein